MKKIVVLILLWGLVVFTVVFSCIQQSSYFDYDAVNSGPKNADYDIIKVNDFCPDIAPISKGMRWPETKGQLFHAKRKDRLHLGWDYPAKCGTSRHAPISGKVIQAGTSRCRGRIVFIDINGKTIAFDKMAAVAVSEKSKVQKGHLLGYDRFGNTLLAPDNGKVLDFTLPGKRGSSQSCGLSIVIEANNHWHWTGMHFSQVWVRAGDLVKKGDEIAKIGDTGAANGCHSHEKWLYKGIVVDPGMVQPDAPLELIALNRAWSGRDLAVISMLSRCGSGAKQLIVLSRLWSDCNIHLTCNKGMRWK